jgi:hypothetical protein
MTPLNAALALTALADVDVELPVDRLARDLDLELLGDVRRVKRTTAVGAASGSGASWTSSICSGEGGWRWALVP